MGDQKALAGYAQNYRHDYRRWGVSPRPENSFLANGESYHDSSKCADTPLEYEVMTLVIRVFSISCS
jgi:hypothetical protein